MSSTRLHTLTAPTTTLSNALRDAVAPAALPEEKSRTAASAALQPVPLPDALAPSRLQSSAGPPEPLENATRGSPKVRQTRHKRASAEAATNAPPLDTMNRRRR